MHANAEHWHDQYRAMIVPHAPMGTISVEADLCITMGTISVLAHCPGTNLNTPSVCSTTSCSLKCCFMYSPLM